ncbi:hypothetical protein [Paraburkholderia hospita]|uniref:hypothetical protein n=1 Tax=Paraburkholderia hospita TaxID=169430 RepID=UPI00115FF7B6|nr:hypothetical protein [Paraburkholderia hospita]
MRAADVAVAAANAPIELRPAASSVMITRKGNLRGRKFCAVGLAYQWNGDCEERRRKGATRLVSRETAGVRIS